MTPTRDLRPPQLTGALPVEELAKVKTLKRIHLHSNALTTAEASTAQVELQGRARAGKSDRELGQATTTTTGHSSKPPRAVIAFARHTGRLARAHVRTVGEGAGRRWGGLAVGGGFFVSRSSNFAAVRCRRRRRCRAELVTSQLGSRASSST